MKTVLITGISRGIGRALAQRFLGAGDIVIGTSTNGSVDIESKNLIVFTLDLSNPRSIVDCVANIVSLNKKIDILINNAGVALDLSSTSVSVETLRQTLEINLIGTIDLTERIIGILSKGAHILNASSSAGSLARTKKADDDEYPAYRISKTALNMYTRTLAVRLSDLAIVSSFHPGWVKTDMGGADAPMSPIEAAEYIYRLAIDHVETGQFWFKCEKYDW